MFASPNYVCIRKAKIKEDKEEKKEKKISPFFER